MVACDPTERPEHHPQAFLISSGSVATRCSLTDLLASMSICHSKLFSKCRTGDVLLLLKAFHGLSLSQAGGHSPGSAHEKDQCSFFQIFHNKGLESGLQTVETLLVW